MKRSLKKAIAFVLSLALAVQILVFQAPAVSAFAQELSEFDYQVWDEGTYVYGYYGDDEDVVIPSDAGITGVSIWNGTFKSLTVPEGVTSVTVCVESMEKLVLPSTVTSLYISYATNLKELDMSKIKADGDYNSYELSNLPMLEDVKLGKIKGWLSIASADKLKSLDASGTELEDLYLYNNSSLSSVKLNKNLDYVSLVDLPKIENVEIPENAFPYLSNVDFDKITIKNNKNGYYIQDGGLYLDYIDYVTEEPIKSLEAIDLTKKTINVAEGTTYINNLGLSGNYYNTREINLPDTVEQLGWYAFDGGDKIEKLTLSKNLITMQGYCIGGFNPKAEIVIPETVRYIDFDAFTGFKGKVSLEKATDSLSEYEGGIYTYAADENGKRYESNIATLVYYPKDKTTCKFNPDTVFIAPNVFMGSKIKSLDIPEGVMWLDLNLKSCKNLTSISIPASVGYIYNPMLAYAPALKKVTVDPANEFLASYKNCVYDKEMTALIDVPGALEKIDIPEGVISLNYYTVAKRYFYDDNYENETIISPEVIFPSTIEEFDPDLSFGSAKIYADTPVSEYIQACNEEFKYWGELYDYDPVLYQYTLRDSVKDLLSMIYVTDEVELKKGNTTVITAEMPAGLNAVSKLTLGNNTECKVSFKSSKKKIASVNSKTGEITAKKKGTCTITVTCTIKNGKKSTSKKFKVKVKVK